MRLLKILVYLCLIPVAGIGQENAENLIIGRWKSNRELTVPTIKLKKEVSAELRAKLDDLFGKMMLTYTANQVDAYLQATDKGKEWRLSYKYTVVMSTDAKIVIRSINPLTKEQEEETINFEGPDRYWISLDKIEGREYFDRIKNEPTANQPLKTMSITVPVAAEPLCGLAIVMSDR